MREATLHQQVTPRMYDASFEHDSCGFGLVSQVDGRASAWVVDTAFDALAKLSHRGGVNADGISGDGCGVLLHRPRPWLKYLKHQGSADKRLLASRFKYLEPRAGGKWEAVTLKRADRLSFYFCSGYAFHEADGTIVQNSDLGGVGGC